MSFFDDASLAFLPSGAAGKDGKAYSIKPVPEYGSELVTNGDFATDSDWTKGTGSTISGGSLNIVAAPYNANTRQSLSLTNGTTYEIVINAIAVGSATDNTFQLGFADSAGNPSNTTQHEFAVGTSVKKLIVTASATDSAIIFRSRDAGTSNLSITNVSVKEVLVGDGDFTFSRGSNLAATRVGADGLIEKGRENLLLQSNQFDTTWSLTNTSVTSGQSGYDGSNNAWLLEKSGSGGHIVQSISQSDIQTYSVYVKANSSNWCRFLITASTGNQGRYFDLSTGAIGGSAYGTEIDATATSVGGGWYRITLTFNETTTSVRIYPAEGNLNTSGTSGSIYIQDAQLEIGLAATDYIESGATTGKAGLLEDEPRFDYSGGATCPSLLLEPSRTNLVTQSEYFATYFSTSGTLIYNEAASPEGVQNGTKIYPTSTGSFKGLSKAFGSTLSSVPYVLSVFAKAGEFEHLYFYNVGSPNGAGGVWFNLTTGSVGTNQAAWTSAKMEDFGNGWYRCSAVITPGGSSDNLYILLADSNGSVTATTNGTDGFYIYGAQFEEGSYPTSYIPNHSGGSVTRGADECEDAGDVNTFNSTEGVLYLEASAIDNDSSEKGLAINDGSTNNRINIRIVNNDIKAYGIVGGSLVCLMSYTAPSVTSINKIAFKYKENDFALWVNGVERVTDTSGSVFPANTLNELSFDYGGPSAFFNGNVKQVLVFKEALSDADLTTLTT